MADADAIAAMLAGIKIYYINLDRATLRREAMEAQLARCDDVVRVAAVDGAADAAAPAARLQAWGLEDDDRSPAELACVLSHLACNNADAQRVSLAAGAPFAPWRRDHWGAGVYLLSRAGAAACADPSTFSPRLGKLVADEASADHTELVHGPSRALNRAYFSGAWHDRRVLGEIFDGRARAAARSPGDADPPPLTLGRGRAPARRDVGRALRAAAGRARGARRLARRPGDGERVAGEVARGGRVVLARDPFIRAADGTQRCAVAAPLVGFASLKALEPWGRATTLYWELSALGTAPAARAYWSDGSDDGSDDESGDAPARAYDPVERWAAGARLRRSGRARRPRRRGPRARRLGALRADEAAWAAGAPPGPWPCRGLALPPRGAVAGRVSVVCPTTADRRPFHALLLANARRQTWPDVELLVYDDGPAPSPLLRGARDCLYVHGGRDPRPSLGEKRNRLLALATGEYVANFDDDNVYAPTYLEAMVRRLDASGAGLVSLDEAWVATLAGAAANGADACRRLGGFRASGETFLHRNVALAAAAYAPLDVGEEVGLLAALPNTAVVDDVGLFLHVEHGRNTVDFELLDGREEDVAFTQLLGRAALPAAAPLRGSWPARELGELRRALAAADAPPPVPPDAAATPERGA
ncbi:hypothetical protein JL721_1181 [Aureococcus anophagefferens]|nr:hypothetical protein JL721_1181 [Aureococcus anophagefferens]